MRMWCAKPVGATHHGRLHNAQATEWREGLDRPGRGHPDLAGIYQPGNMTIDARKKKKKTPDRRKRSSHSLVRKNRQTGVNKIAQILKRCKWDSNTGFSDCWSIKCPAFHINITKPPHLNDKLKFQCHVTRSKIYMQRTLNSEVAKPKSHGKN